MLNCLSVIFSKWLNEFLPLLYLLSFQIVLKLYLSCDLCISTVFSNRYWLFFFQKKSLWIDSCNLFIHLNFDLLLNLCSTNLFLFLISKLLLKNEVQHGNVTHVYSMHIPGKKKLAWNSFMHLIFVYSVIFLGST